MTFVFNGGPARHPHTSTWAPWGRSGSTSPRTEHSPRCPRGLSQNESSWLAFTDLVFVDPVGTGFSRIIEPEEKKDEAKDEKPEDAHDPKEYFGYKRDLESLCEFMGRWLSDHGRWGSPVFIAGESYGGYRVGRLVRMLQETAGHRPQRRDPHLAGARDHRFAPTDYDVLGWIDRAADDGRRRSASRPLACLRAREPLSNGCCASRRSSRRATTPRSSPAVRRCPRRSASGYSRGWPISSASRSTSSFALKVAISIRTFARELSARRAQGAWPLRHHDHGRPTHFRTATGLRGPIRRSLASSPAFTMAVNRQLRSEIGVETDREYMLLSYEVNTAWKIDTEQHAFALPPGATDDFRYGMALNPHMKAFITHGQLRPRHSRTTRAIDCGT